MRSTLQHLQIASYLERGIQDTIHGTLQANRDIDDPDRLQTKIEADLSMFAFGAQLHALSFLSRQDHIACLNGGHTDFSNNHKLRAQHHLNESIKQPNDWVLGKDGKYVWAENVTSVNDIDLNGREYIGKSLNDVKSHFIENNNWISRTFGDKNGGFLASTDINSYYNAKVPLAVQDMFNKHKWFYNLKERGDNRADAGYSQRVRNNTLKNILRGHKQTITGSVNLDGVNYDYTAHLGASNNKNLTLIGFFDEHPMKDWTLATMHGGSIEGEFFYLSNSQIGINFPVLTIHFKNHEAASSWFLKYSINR